MCKNIQRKPDFYLIKVESNQGSDIYSCWVQKNVWVGKTKMYQVEVRPYLKKLSFSGCDSRHDLILLMPRCPGYRLLAGLLPDRRHKLAYFFRFLWSPCSVYILTYIKDNQAAKSQISRDCVEVTDIGEIYLTGNGTRKELSGWYGTIGDNLTSLNMLNCDLPFCKNGCCQKDDYKFIEYTSKGAVLNCKCGDKYLYDYPKLMQIADNGQTKPYMKKNLLEEWHEDI